MSDRHILIIGAGSVGRRHARNLASLGCRISAMDPRAERGAELVTELETFKADVANVIPAQSAGRIAIAAGLTNESGFCPIDATSMRSTVDEAIYVIGDASIAGAMPKSGFSANILATLRLLVMTRSPW